MWKSLTARTLDGAVSLALDLAKELRQAARDEAVVEGVRIYTCAGRPGEFLFNPAAVEQFAGFEAGDGLRFAEALEPASLHDHALRFSTPP